MPIEGEPTIPKLIFSSGDEVWVLRTEPTERDGVPHLILFMIPTEHVIFRYGLTDDDLDEELKSDGVIIREYPTVHFHDLSWNPEAPIGFMTCGFNGDTAKYDMILAQDASKILSLQKLVNLKALENQALAEELKVTIQKLSDLRSELGGAR